MKIDISKYDAKKQYIVEWFHEKGNGDFTRTVSTMASAYFIPVIAVAFWLAPETGWSEESIKSIKNIIDFYGYTEIKGKPEGSPI